MISLRKAIDNKCKECIYDPDQPGLGTWVKQVEDCTSSTCPLFEVRPLTVQTAQLKAQGSVKSERAKAQHQKKKEQGK